MMITTMYYFGPWNSAGHHLCKERGVAVYGNNLDSSFPWKDYEIDCALQPGCFKNDNGRCKHVVDQTEGPAMLHHKSGWTALSFWDRSVDERGGCNSTYFAKGTFTFEQMVEMAKDRFAYRWNKMKFEVTHSKGEPS